MIQAYGALFAWKLSLHGVDASSTKQWVGSKYFQAINGHRDAASTACPGRYLYAKIPEIRRLAAEAQRGWDGRDLESNLAGTPHPDLVVRRASDGKGFILPTGGLTALRPGVAAADRPRRRRSPVVSPRTSPVTASATSLVRRGRRRAAVRPGNGNGAFGARCAPSTGFAGHDLVTAVGDLNGDGRNDLVARGPRPDGWTSTSAAATARFRVEPLGTDLGRLHRAGRRRRRRTATARPTCSAGTSGGGAVAAPRHRQGRLRRRGRRSRATGRSTPTITGYGDFDQDGETDLFAREPQSKHGYVLPVERRRHATAARSAR